MDGTSYNKNDFNKKTSHTKHFMTLFTFKFLKMQKKKDHGTLAQFYNIITLSLCANKKIRHRIKFFFCTDLENMWDVSSHNLKWKGRKIYFFN